MLSIHLNLLSIPLALKSIVPKASCPSFSLITYKSKGAAAIPPAPPTKPASWAAHLSFIASLSRLIAISSAFGDLACKDTEIGLLLPLEFLSSLLVLFWEVYRLLVGVLSCFSNDARVWWRCDVGCWRSVNRVDWVSWVSCSGWNRGGLSA